MPHVPTLSGCHRAHHAPSRAAACSATVILTLDPAIAVRSGEHACCRFEGAEDRWRIASALVRDGLRRGHRLIYLHDRPDGGAFSTQLAAVDDAVGPALARGQLSIRCFADTDAPEGTVRIERILESLRRDHDRSLADGYAGTTLIAELSEAFCRAGGGALLREYERGLDALRFSGAVRLCQYDHPGPDANTLGAVIACHDADLAPELATIGRSGSLAAARLRDGWLRLAGDLDFERAGDLDDVLTADSAPELKFDLADLRYVDVAGLRALRGRQGQRVRIAGASAAVERLAELLAWDTDPAVALVEEL
jgi:anti-anti-sigma regulatory factor